MIRWYFCDVCENANRQAYRICVCFVFFILFFHHRHFTPKIGEYGHQKKNCIEPTNGFTIWQLDTVDRSNPKSTVYVMRWKSTYITNTHTHTKTHRYIALECLSFHIQFVGSETENISCVRLGVIANNRPFTYNMIKYFQTFRWATRYHLFPTNYKNKN